MPIQESRWAILQHLKRQGSATVESLSQALHLAPMTVRQHLAVLERDNVIASHTVRHGPGRPAFQYTLTASGQELFPKSYDKLAVRLLQEVTMLESDEIALLAGREKVSLVFNKMADRMATEYGQEIEGDTLETRVGVLVDLLQEREGTLTEWAPSDNGIEILDYNCPFQKIVSLEPELCSWHVRFLSGALGTDVKMEESIAEGHSCCRYRVQPISTATTIQTIQSQSFEPASPS